MIRTIPMLYLLTIENLKLHYVMAETSWLRAKYGVLPEDWKAYINQGIHECMRVLEPDGILIFKWNEDQIKTSEILASIDFKPLFGDKRSKTHWMCFMKIV